jgi:uncharacterized protein involved in propanediol utilization
MYDKLSKFATDRATQTIAPSVAHYDGPPNCKTHTAIGHHGEILQGIAEDQPSRLRRVLVSLACGSLRSNAVFMPHRSDPLIVDPPWKVKALRAAELTLQCCDGSSLGGRLVLRSNIPLGWGLGSSTADVIATIRAVAHALDRTFTAEEVAALSVKSEDASDSVMFEDCAVIFAHRDGVVLERLARHLPPVEVLGFNTDTTQAGVDTLSFNRAYYTWWEIEAFRPLLGLLRRAVYVQDSSLLGLVASASARINQRFLPKPHFDELERIAERLGAVGLQVAHSGTIVGMLFDPQIDDLDKRIRYARSLVRELGFVDTWRFRSESRVVEL